MKSINFSTIFLIIGNNILYILENLTLSKTKARLSASTSQWMTGRKHVSVLSLFETKYLSASQESINNHYDWLCLLSFDENIKISKISTLFHSKNIDFMSLSEFWSILSTTTKANMGKNHENLLEMEEFQPNPILKMIPTFSILNEKIEVSSTFFIAS